jgi:hypothetical protein
MQYALCLQVEGHSRPQETYSNHKHQLISNKILPGRVGTCTYQSVTEMISTPRGWQVLVVQATGGSNIGPSPPAQQPETISTEGSLKALCYENGPETRPMCMCTTVGAVFHEGMWPRSHGLPGDHVFRDIPAIVGGNWHVVRGIVSSGSG